MTTNDELGAVDYAIVAFPESRFTGQIAPELVALVAEGTIRIIEMLDFGRLPHEVVQAAHDFALASAGKGR